MDEPDYGMYLIYLFLDCDKWLYSRLHLVSVLKKGLGGRLGARQAPSEVFSLQIGRALGST